MNLFEMAEKLRQHTGVTFEEAKAALEKCQGDMLDAAILLEQQGKTKTGGGTYSTRQETPSVNSTMPEDSESFSQAAHRGMRWLVKQLGKWLRVGNNNYLVVCHDGEKPVKFPVTLFVILLLVAFWVVVPLLIIGLFTGFTYRFEGPNFGKKQVNDALDQMSATANQVKEDFINEASKKEE